MNHLKVALLVAGIKGLNFLNNFIDTKAISFVSSYPFKGLQFQPEDKIRSLCREHHYSYHDSKELTKDLLDQVDLVFVAGWQYLLDISAEKTIILHDSLLPKFRGFSPTVNALICGASEVGVTAFKPVQDADAGPIYEQIILPVTYPARIKDIYSKLGHCYAKCCHNILEKKQKGCLVATPQNEEEITLSIWRGKEDLFIDWTREAHTIRRLVDAVSWPYEGARSFYLGQEIIIHEVEEVLPKQRFELYHCGKIWKILDNCPEVICQKGLIRILSAKDLNGGDVSFTRLRERLSNAHDLIV
jgi:methionyl-tRNA formyltransferase